MNMNSDVSGKILFPWRHLLLLALTIFLSPLPPRFLHLEGRTLMEGTHLGLSAPKMATLYTFYIVGLCVTSCPLIEELSLINAEKGISLIE